MDFDRMRDTIKKQYDDLLTYALGAATGIFGIFSTVGRIDEIYKLYTVGSLGLQNILSFILLILTLFLGFSWFVSGKYELSLLRRYYEGYFPPIAFSSLPTVIMLAITLVLLVITSDNILLYSVIALIYSIIALVANLLVRSHFKDGFNRAKDNDGIPRVYNEEMEKYYIERKNGRDGMILIVASLVSILLMMSGRPEYISYLVLICSIVLNEAIVWSWRSRLYRKLRSI